MERVGVGTVRVWNGEERDVVICSVYTLRTATTFVVGLSLARLAPPPPSNRSTMANFIVADDHPFVRQGIKSFLKNTTEHDVIAECDSGPDTVRKVSELRPDGLILDLDLPGMDGLEVVRRVHTASPETRIIVLTMHASAAFVMMAFRNGASAYLLKNADVSDLGAAVEDVLRTNRFTGPHIDLMAGVAIDVGQEKPRGKRDVLPGEDGAQAKTG